MIKLTETSWVIGLIAATVVFGWGGFQWWQAVAYLPVTPVQAPLNYFSSASPEPPVDLARYQRLFTGELFFGTVAQPLLDFYSSLKVLGLIKGVNPRAVVSIGDSEQTWIVKPGSVVEGEQIITIGEDYILVKNENGEGMVLLESIQPIPGPTLFEDRAD